MIDYEKLWAEINKKIESENGKKLPHEKTLNELAETWGMGHNRTQELINKLVANGTLISREVIASNGKRAIVYSPIQT